MIQKFNNLWLLNLIRKESSKRCSGSITSYRSRYNVFLITCSASPLPERIFFLKEASLRTRLARIFFSSAQASGSEARQPPILLRKMGLAYGRVNKKKNKNTTLRYSAFQACKHSQEERGRKYISSTKRERPTLCLLLSSFSFWWRSPAVLGAS